MSTSALKIGIDGTKLTVRLRAPSTAPDYGAGWSSSARLSLPKTSAPSIPELNPEPTPPSARPSTRPTPRPTPPTPRARPASPATLSSFVRKIWTWLKAKRALQLRSKRLTVTETVSLGDKRFVSIVRVDDQHYLIGGSASGVALLTDLPERPQEPEAFGTILGESWANARSTESCANVRKGA